MTDTDPSEAGDDAPAFPEELQNMDAEEREARAEELQAEADRAAAKLEADQRAILDELEAEHGGDLIETDVVLPGENAATVSVVLNGELIDRLSHVTEQLNQLDAEDTEDVEAVVTIPEIMDESSQICADALEEPKYSKELFYAIYERYGPEALGEHLETISEAIKRERKRKAGDADGFRE